MSYHFFVLNGHGRTWQDTLIVTVAVTMIFTVNWHSLYMETCVVVGYMAAANWPSTFMSPP